MKKLGDVNIEEARKSHEALQLEVSQQKINVYLDEDNDLPTLVAKST